jgi:hypothetical protein
MNISDILLKYDTDKVTHHNYGDAYNEIFSKFDADAPISILEIGTQKGGSLCAWKDYFINGSVTGVDIVDAVKPEYRRANIDYRVSDIKDWYTDDMYDIIIDDGSHLIDDVDWAARYLFPKLKRGGYYIIEDVQKPVYWIQRMVDILPDGYRLYTKDMRGHYDDFLIIIKNEIT